MNNLSLNSKGPKNPLQVEGKEIIDSSSGHVNILGTDLEEEEEDSETETNSEGCDELDETESSESFKVLVENKPFSSGLIVKEPSRTPCSNVGGNHNSNISLLKEDKDGFTTVYSKNQKRKLKRQNKETSPHFDQEETPLLNQVQFDTPKHLRGRPKREIQKRSRFR